jgi:hypothetical protein
VRRPLGLTASGTSAYDDLAAVLLGPTHPLVLATMMVQRLVKQWVLLAAFLVGCIIATTGVEAPAWPLILGAGIMLSILTLLIAGFQQCKRDHAIDLILNGYQNVQIAAIQAQRRRLLAARCRLTVARGIERTINEVPKSFTLQARGTDPLFQPQTIAGAVEDLRAVARALITEPVSAQGIARAERALTDGASPLYGHDVIALWAEIRRVHHDLLPDGPNAQALTTVPPQARRQRSP